MTQGSKYTFTQKLADNLIKYLELGIDINEACALVEISKPTYYAWLKKYPSFNSRAGSARARMEARRLANIERATAKDWKADSWLLEKQFPKKYGSIARLQLEADVKGTFELSNDKLTEIAARLLDRKGKKNGK